MIKLTEEKTDPEYCNSCQAMKEITEIGKIKKPDGLLSPYVVYRCSKCGSKAKSRDLV